VVKQQRGQNTPPHKESERQGGWQEKKVLSILLIMGDIKSNPEQGWRDLVQNVEVDLVLLV
jgi:hypothetical protein